MRRLLWGWPRAGWRDQPAPLKLGRGAFLEGLVQLWQRGNLEEKSVAKMLGLKDQAQEKTDQENVFFYTLRPGPSSLNLPCGLRTQGIFHHVNYPFLAPRLLSLQEAGSLGDAATSLAAECSRHFHGCTLPLFPERPRGRGGRRKAMTWRSGAPEEQERRNAEFGSLLSQGHLQMVEARGAGTVSSGPG